MKHIYQFNEEVPCLIKGYDYDSQTYIIETLTDHVIGYVYRPKHPKIAKILKNARYSHSVVSLRFMKALHGKLLFKYIIEKPTEGTSEPVVANEEEIQDILQDSPAESVVTTSQEEISEEPAEPEVHFESEPFSVRLSSTDMEWNRTLLTSLATSVGECIDNEDKYELAVNILSADADGVVCPDLSSMLYAKATDEYKRRFWEDDVLPYCSNKIISDAWEEADDDGKKIILFRLGISLESADSLENNVDNSNQSVAEIETHASNVAIQERHQTQTRLNKQRSELGTRQQSLNRQHATIRHEQQNLQEQTVLRMSQARTQEERQQIQQENQQNQNRMQEELRSVETQQQEVSSQIVNVDNAITETQEEINTIRQSASMDTVGGRGKLKINIKWNTIDDVDLHVYDPDGNHIYYGDKQKYCQGILGQLDVDANAGSPFTTSPQENIYWDEKAPVGHYKVDVNLYNKRSGAQNIPFTVTFYPEKGNPKVFTGKLTTEKQTINLVEFDYGEDGIKYCGR